MFFTGERFIPGQTEKEIAIEHLQRYYSVAELCQGKVALDAACGEGYGSSILAQHAEKVYGIDISQEAVNWAKDHYQAKNLEFIQGTIKSLPFEDNSIDIVVSFETIEHVNEEIQKDFLKEIRRVLKKEGLLMISTPDKLTYSDQNCYKNEYHDKEFYFDEFKDFLLGYFSHIKLYDQSKNTFSILNMSSKDEVSFKLITDDDYINSNRLFIIAVCSNDEISLINNNIQTIMLSRKQPYYHSSLYIDLGQGYSEKDKITVNLEMRNHKFFLKFSLKGFENIHGIRWDPLDGFFCQCRVKNIITDGRLKSIKAINAWRTIDGEEEFLTTDPIYMLEGDFSQGTFVQIEGYLALLNHQQIASGIKETMLKDSNRLKEEYKKLLEEKDAIIEQNKFHYDKLLEEKDAILAQKIEKKKAIIAQLTKTESDYETLKGIVAIKEEEIKRILDSSSWKITAPLRYLGDYFKK